MKLLITKICKNAHNTPALTTLADHFYCNIEANLPEDRVIITKNDQLTDDEFIVLAGNLVMYGFNVELLANW